MKSVLHPEFKPTPFWWEAWRPSEEPSIDPPRTVSVAIIGGGYAGLNAALELTRSGVDCVVLESRDFGYGASTRNGGAVSGGVNIGKGMGGKKNPADEAARQRTIESLMVDGSAAFSLIEDIIAREKIECFWQKRGRFTGAYTKKHYEALAKRLDVLNDKADSDAYMLPKARQREEIASDFYQGGMVLERAALVHPALYYGGLLAACKRHGIKLASRTEVTGIAGQRGRFTLTTSRGPIQAEEIVVGTNGYTGDVTPQLKRRLVPVASHIIATEELPDDLAASLIPNKRAIGDTPRILCYYRMSPDGKRMIFGGRARFTPGSAERNAPILHRFMTDRFPQLRDVRVTHTWTGNVAFTLDYLPHMGVQDGLHYALGCNGSGVAMMTYLGHQTARKIVGGGNKVSAFELPSFPDQPGYTGTPWFLPAIGGWYRLRDRIDRYLDA